MTDFLVDGFKYYAPFLLVMSGFIALFIISKRAAKNFWNDYANTPFNGFQQDEALPISNYVINQVYQGRIIKDGLVGSETDIVLGFLISYSHFQSTAILQDVYGEKHEVDLITLTKAPYIQYGKNNDVRGQSESNTQ